jgi:hypothetical protein
MDGNEAVWRKFVNAVALDVFRIDRAVVGGELGVDGVQAARWRALADERLSEHPVRRPRQRRSPRRPQHPDGPRPVSRAF